MEKVFESDLKKGYLDLYVTEGRLFAVSGFARCGLGVGLDIPDEEAADLAEALLRHLGADTARSVFESVTGRKTRSGKEKTEAG